MALRRTASVDILALMEARSVTGPARNLIAFAERARDISPPTAAFCVKIATFERERCPAASPNGFVTSARSRGIEVRVVPEERRFDIGVAARLVRLSAELTPNIIQTHNVKSHFMTRLAGLQRTRPWVAFHHGFTATDLKDRVYNQFNRWSLRAADMVITMNGVFVSDLVRMGVKRDRIRIMPNAVDASAWADAERQTEGAARAGSSLALLTAGRLSREKGHSDLLSAFALVCKRRSDVHLVIAGDGPERTALSRRCTSLGIAERVSFVGHVTDLAPLYASADAFVLPSHSEGSPNALLEAMAAGLPCIATAVGGVPETISDGKTGVLAPPRSPRGLADAILRVLSDPALAGLLAQTAKDRVASHYNHDVRTARLCGLYNELLDTWQQRHD